MSWTCESCEMQDDQLEHTYSSYVRIRDEALKTCQRWWMIGRGGDRGSGISMLAARHDGDIYIHSCGNSCYLFWSLKWHATSYSKDLGNLFLFSRQLSLYFQLKGNKFQALNFWTILLVDHWISLSSNCTHTIIVPIYPTLFLWHINLYWLFNAKSIFIPTNSSILNNSVKHKYTV